MIVSNGMCKGLKRLMHIAPNSCNLFSLQLNGAYVLIVYAFCIEKWHMISSFKNICMNNCKGCQCITVLIKDFKSKS